MFRVEKQFRFEASHQLPQHSGKCARLHGHSWVGRVIVEGKRLHESGPQTGMVIDFAEMAKPIKTLVDAHLDHYHLNDSTGLKNPTSEELARWIYLQLQPFILGMVAVQIEETCTSRCEYRFSSLEK